MNWSISSTIFPLDMWVIIIIIISLFILKRTSSFFFSLSLSRLPKRNELTCTLDLILFVFVICSTFLKKKTTTHHNTNPHVVWSNQFLIVLFSLFELGWERDGSFFNFAFEWSITSELLILSCFSFYLLFTPRKITFGFGMIVQINLFVFLAVVSPSLF